MKPSYQGLNSYVEAGSDPAYEDPYTKPCRECDGVGFGDGAPDAAVCKVCDGTGRVECERPSKEDFAPEWDDD